MIRTALYKLLLPELLAHCCESRIPRSGRRGEAVNCYVTAIDGPDSPYFVATRMEGNELLGLRWDGSSYAAEHRIPIADIDTRGFRITHYYGLAEVTFSSIFDFAWNYFTRWVYLKINVYRYLDSTHQYLFNKKKLVTKRRMDLLRFMMNDQLDRDHEGIDLITLMTKIYSMRMFLHPSWEIQERKVRLYLDSLVHSGELNHINDEYVVTGGAIRTIEIYEEDERRHTEAVKLHRRMFWLTVIGAAFAFVQTGVIKRPTIFDLTQ